MIGVFDSGVGGLGVLGHLRRELPDADIRYLADRMRAPYGRRPVEEIRSFACQITDHLAAAGARLVVIACNTASSAALHHLRVRNPELRFVGMEPAVKPAAAASRSGVVGVLATTATIQGHLLASVVDRFAEGVRVEVTGCDGWVEMVEAGVLDGPDVEEAVRAAVVPVLERGADTLVLGCTHFPFLEPVIRRVAGPEIHIIDPAPAVARQTRRVAEELGLTTGTAEVAIEITGDFEGTAELVGRLAGFDVPVDHVTFAGHV